MLRLLFRSVKDFPCKYLGDTFSHTLNMPFLTFYHQCLAKLQVFNNNPFYCNQILYWAEQTLMM